MPREFVESFVESLFKIRAGSIVPEFGLVTNFVSSTRFSARAGRLSRIQDETADPYQCPRCDHRFSGNREAENHSTRTFHVSRRRNGASVSTRRPHSIAELFILLDWKVSNIGGRGPSTYIPMRELEKILCLFPRHPVIFSILFLSGLISTCG